MAKSREEELKELAELRELAKLEAMASEEEDYFEEEEDEEEDEVEEVEQELPPVEGQTHQIQYDEKGMPITTALDPALEQAQIREGQESAVMGAAMGLVEGIPFAKHTMAGVEAAVQVANNQGSSFGENYEYNLSDWNKEINKAEEKHPTAFMAGDLYGGAALLPTGAGLKGARAVGLAAGYGAASAASREESTDPWKIITSGAEGGAIGGAFGVAGEAIGLAARAVGTGLGLIAPESAKAAMGAVSGKWKEKLNSYIIRTGNPDVNDAQKTLQFVKRVSNVSVDGQPLFGSSILKGKSFGAIRDHSLKARKRAGNNLGQVVNTIDEMSDGLKISGKDLFDSVKQKLGLVEDLMSPENTTREQAAQTIKHLKSIFMDEVEGKGKAVIKEVSTGLVDEAGKPIMRKVEEVVPEMVLKWKELSPNDLHKFKIHYTKTSGKIANAAAKAQDATKAKSLSMLEEVSLGVSGAVNDAMNEVASKIAKESPELLNAYKNANLHYSDMDMVYKVSQSAALKSGDSMTNILKRALGVRGLLVAQVSSTTGANMVGAAAIGAAFNEVIQNPKTDSKFAIVLERVSNHLKNDPESPYLKRILTATAVSSYDDNIMSDKAVMEAITGVDAEIMLKTSPVKRNIEDIRNKSDYILQSLTFHDREKAEEFRELLKHRKNDEAIRSLMAEVSKDADMESFFEEGKGIDGRVYTPEDKEELRDELNAQDISLNQRLRLEKELDMNGTIPVIQQEPDRFLEFRKRDKDKPRY